MKTPHKYYNSINARWLDIGQEISPWFLQSFKTVSHILIFLWTNTKQVKNLKILVLCKKEMEIRRLLSFLINGNYVDTLNKHLIFTLLMKDAFNINIQMNTWNYKKKKYS